MKSTLPVSNRLPVKGVRAKRRRRNISSDSSRHFLETEFSPYLDQQISPNVSSLPTHPYFHPHPLLSVITTHTQLLLLLSSNLTISVPLGIDVLAKLRVISLRVSVMLPKQLIASKRIMGPSSMPL